MRVNVSGLLRDGNLVLTAERAAGEDLFGSLADRIVSSDQHLDMPTLAEEDWRPAL